jgi:hypothetical protein
MTATNHALTGVVVALVINQPALAIPLAFLSHFAVDVIPHFEARDLPSEVLAKLFIISDVVIAGTVTILLTVFLHTNLSPSLIFTCMLAAISPDLIWAWRYFRIKNLDKVFVEPMSWLSRWHLKIQWSETLPGFLVEAGWLVLMSTLIDRLA